MLVLDDAVWIFLMPLMRGPHYKIAVIRCDMLVINWKFNKVVVSSNKQTIQQNHVSTFRFFKTILSAQNKY